NLRNGEQKLFSSSLRRHNRRYLWRSWRIERDLGHGFVGSVNMMNQRKQIITVYLFVVNLVVFYCHSVLAAEAPVPRRVGSLAPSVTETLFALGFGDRVVGVTTYCDYPPEARRIPKIGGYINPSLEAIADKRPDLVIGVRDSSHPVKTKEIESLGIKVVLI